MDDSSGFTLLEILIALFIFTIVAVIMTSALHNVITIQATTEKHAASLTALQNTFLRLSQDINQAINRPITTANGNLEGFIGTDTSITFTHAGWVNPLAQLPRSTLQRVKYQFHSHQLERITWPVLDQTKDITPDTRILMNNISRVQFEFLDAEGRFKTRWRPDTNGAIKLPRAVRVTMTLENAGTIIQLYMIPGY